MFCSDTGSRSSRTELVGLVMRSVGSMSCVKS